MPDKIKGINDKVADISSKPKTKIASKPIDDWINIVNPLGLYQWFLTLCLLLFILGANVNVSFAGYYGGVTPSWQCCDEAISNGTQCSDNTTCAVFDHCVNLTFSAQFDGYVQEFKLLCDDSYYVKLINMMQMIGLLIGSLVIGQIADRWGRKWTSVACAILQAATGFAMAFSISWQMLMALMFINGIAYVTQHWRLLVMVGNGMQFLLPFLLIFGANESPRWFLQANRKQDAIKALRNIAKWNRRELPAEFNIDGSDGESHNEKVRVWHLFTTNRKLLLYTLVGTFVFYASQQAVMGLFYGLNLLGDQLYLNYLLLMSTGFIDLTICLLDYFFPQLIGRKLLSCATMAVSTTCTLSLTICFACGVSTSAWYVVMFSCLGQTSAYEAVNLGLFTHFLELYPTEMRGIAGSYVSTWANIGAAVAPNINYFSKYWHPIPYLWFGVQMGISFLLVLFALPETKHKPPPERVDDM